MTKKVKRGRRASQLLAGLLLGVSPLAVSPNALAQTEAALASETRIDYDIPAQPLSTALAQYAEQSGIRALYPHGRFANANAPAVRGRFTREEALQRLLANSGFSGEITGTNTLVLEQDQSPQSGAANAESDRVRQGPANANAGDGTADEEIVVTGTRIRGAVPAGANLITLDRQSIDDTGQSTVFEALRALPQNFPGSQSEASQLNSANNNLSFGSAIDLRGLGSDATLTLVNGRRIAPAGFGNFIDVSAVPLAAVERIEVLADGASATYGSDAVGGVVNIIMRDDFSGAESRFRFGAAEGGAEEANFSQTFGAVWQGGHAVLGYEYRHRNALASADRPFTADSDLRPLGGDNFSRTTASPGNITRIGATNVVFAIPDGQDGVGLDQSELLAGVVNLQNTREDTDVLPRQESHSVFFSGRQELTPAIELFFDAFATERSALMRNTAIMSNITVPQTNAFRVANNLFPGQGNMVIAYSFNGDAGPVVFDTNARTFSGVLGFSLELPREWSAEFSGGYGRHRDYVDFGNSIDTAALNAALASSDPATSFNPFGDGGDNAHVMDRILRHQVTDNDSRLTAFGFKADGPLFQLPAGPVRMAIGVERRTEAFEVHRITYSNSGAPTVVATPAPGERDTDAAFLELAVPIVSDGPLFLRDLDVSASVRQEQSDDYGRAVVPKLGVNWGVSDDFDIRATWGLSFKAPRFDQTLSSIGGSLLVLNTAQDPLADGGSTGLLSIAGGNPDLEPEEAESWTAGFLFRPSGAPGLSFGATYFDIDFANRIAVPGDVLSAIANPAPYSAVLIRDPSQAVIDSYLAILSRLGGAMPADGIELIWDGRVTNLSSLRVRGVDLNGAYEFDTDAGAVAITMNTSHLLQFERQANPSAPGEQLLDTLYNPIAWRVRAGVVWSGGPWRASAYLNYLDSYRDTVSNPDRTIDSWATYDVRLSHFWGSQGDRNGRGAELSLSVQNLFDEDPPFVNSSEGLAFDTRNATPLGRFLSIELRQRW